MSHSGTIPPAALSATEAVTNGSPANCNLRKSGVMPCLTAKLEELLQLLMAWEPPNWMKQKSQLGLRPKKLWACEALAKGGT